MGPGFFAASSSVIDERFRRWRSEGIFENTLTGLHTLHQVPPLVEGGREERLSDFGWASASRQTMGRREGAQLASQAVLHSHSLVREPQELARPHPPDTAQWRLVSDQGSPYITAIRRMNRSEATAKVA
jgi:hypothetical protein